MRYSFFSFIRFSVLVVLILLSVGVLLWLIGKDLGISGRLDMVYDFSNDSPFIRRFWPPGRVSPIEIQGRDAIQHMRIDPVLVDVQLPRMYRDATVEAVYRKPAGQELKVGIRVRPDGWFWEIRSFSEEPDIRPGYVRGRVAFDELKRFDTHDGKIHFLLNAPGLSEEKEPITFTEFRVIATKEPLHWWDTLPRSLGFLKRLF